MSLFHQSFPPSLSISFCSCVTLKTDNQILFCLLWAIAVQDFINFVVIFFSLIHACITISLKKIMPRNFNLSVNFMKMKKNGEWKREVGLHFRFIHVSSNMLDCNPRLSKQPPTRELYGRVELVLFNRCTTKQKQQQCLTVMLLLLVLPQQYSMRRHYSEVSILGLGNRGAPCCGHVYLTSVKTGGEGGVAFLWLLAC